MLGSTPIFRNTLYEFKLTFGHQHLAHVGKTLLGRDVQAGEAILVLYGWVGTALDEELHDIEHVLLDSSVQRGVESDLLVLLNVRVGFVLQQGLDHGLVLGFNCEMQRSHSIDVLRIFVDFAVVQQRDRIVDIVMRNRMEEHFRSHLFYFL